MKEEDIRTRIDSLLVPSTGTGNRGVQGYEVFNAALSLTALLHGPQSPQLRDLTNRGQSLSGRFNGVGLADQLSLVGRAALQNLRAELDGGLFASLQKEVTGEVLADFLQLARAALQETNAEAKNVAAVLAAALFEDTLRRMASVNNLPHTERLQDVLTNLKDTQLLQGTQVGIANSYLNFRNSALHAQWDRIERESIVSVLGFVEQLLMRHFS